MHNTETLHVQMSIPVQMLTDWCRPPFDKASFRGWLWWAKLYKTRELTGKDKWHLSDISLYKSITYH